MNHIMFKILRSCLKSVERDNHHILNRLHCIMTVASIGWRRIDGLQSIFLPFTIVIACLYFLSPMPLRADEIIGLEALLELDPLDWSSIQPRKIIDQCTMVLANKPKMKEDQLCRLYLLRGEALFRVGKEKAAIRDLTELLNIRPKDCLALRFRGETFFSLREYDKAQADFETLIKLQPKLGIGYACLALCLHASGHNDTSKKIAEKAIMLAPDEPEGYLARAKVHLSMQEYEEGLKDLNRCITLSYGGGTILAAQPFLMRVGVLLTIFDNPKKALPDLMMAQGLDRYKEDSSNLFCVYYFKTGNYKMAFHLSEQFQNGESQVLDSVIRINCLIERNRNKEALETAESIVRRMPRWWGSYLHRGEVFFAQERYADALQDYDKSLSFRDNDIGAMAAKAYLLAACPKTQFRDGQKAKTLAAKCCEITANRVPRHLMLLAMAYAECGDYKKAAHLAKKSLVKADSSFPYLADYRRRLALFEDGKPYRFAPGSRTFDYLFP